MQRKTKIYSMLWTSVAALSVSILIFFAWVISGKQIHLGQNIISGGVILDGEILNLVDYPQGLDFNKEVTGMKGTPEGQMELHTSVATLRIGDIACELSFDQQ